MDYKEKYEALLANIKAYHARFGDTCNLKKELEECVPELRESEDERVRKELIQYLRDYPHLPNGKYSRSDFFAWLEKKKEQRYTKEEVLEELRIDLCNNDIYRVPEWLREVLLMAKENGKKEQQHAEWTGYSGIVIDKTKYSELTDAERAILRGFTRVTGLSHFPITIIKETAQDFLAHLPAEWSEEDEKIRSAILLMMKVPRKEIFEARGITKEQALDWLERQKKTEGDQIKSGHGCQATAPPWDPETEHQCDCEHVGCHINNCRRWCRRYMAEIPYTNCGPACSGYSHKNTGGISVKKPTWTGNDSMALVSLKAIINNSNHDEARKKELLDWIDGRLGPQDGELMWLFAKAGTKFPADALVFGTGEDKDPRIVRCAVNDCYYLVVSDILPPKSVADKLGAQYGESHGEPAPDNQNKDKNT